MPDFVTFPAGASTTTMTIYAVAGTTWTGPETAVVNISGNAAYAVGTPSSATLTLQ